MNTKEHVRHYHAHIVIILLSLILGFLVASAWYNPRSTSIAAPAATTGLAALEDAFVQVADRARPAVVNISAVHIAEGRSGELEEMLRRLDPLFREGAPRPPLRVPSLGSGFVIRPDGYILTNNHVIENADDIRVTLLDKREFSAEVVGTDKKTELAVIKIDADNLPTLTLGDSEAARIGQWALAIGSPFRQGWTVTVGVLSAKHRSIPGETEYLAVNDLLQTDAAINPGNSGGPLLDIQGNVIGINVAIQSEGPVPRNAGIGFAIPANKAKVIADQLIEHGKVARGYLGIRYREATPEEKEFFGEDRGVLVVDVEKDSPAGKAGVAPEDILVEFAGREIERQEDLEDIVTTTPPGETVDAVVVRGTMAGDRLQKTEKRLRVTLGKPPADVLGPTTRTATATPEPPEGAEALGITVEDVTDELATQLKLEGERGVAVKDVAADSPAAGYLDLRQTTIVFKVNGQLVKDAKDFQERIAAAQRGRFIVLSIGYETEEGLQRDVVTIRTR